MSTHGVVGPVARLSHGVCMRAAVLQQRIASSAYRSERSLARRVCALAHSPQLISCARAPLSARALAQLFRSRPLHNPYIPSPLGGISVGKHGSRFGQIRPGTWANLVRIRPHLAKLGQVLAESGGRRAQITQQMSPTVFVREMLEYFGGACPRTGGEHVFCLCFNKQAKTCLEHDQGVGPRTRAAESISLE